MHIVLSAKPQDLRLNLPHAALLLLDMPPGAAQADPLAAAVPGSAAPIEAIVPVVRRVLQVWRAWGGFVVHARTGGWAPTADLSAHSGVGAAWGQGIQAAEGELRIAKPCQGAFYRTCLMEALEVREVEQLIFVGAHAEAGVQTTLREATDRGFECLLLADAVASARPAFTASTFEMAQAPGGPSAWVVPSHALLSASAWWPVHQPQLAAGDWLSGRR
jgi:nicotinamidase-related amidase